MRRGRQTTNSEAALGVKQIVSQCVQRDYCLMALAETQTQCLSTWGGVNSLNTADFILFFSSSPSPHKITNVLLIFALKCVAGVKDKNKEKAIRDKNCCMYILV